MRGRLGSLSPSQRRDLVNLLVIVALALVIAAIFTLRSGAEENDPERDVAADSLGQVELAPSATGDAAALFVTGSWYELGFTAPVFPDGGARRPGGLDQALVALMGRAQRTIDVAVYLFDSLDVADAMARAAGRGVRVRMVTDSDTISNARRDPAVDAATARVRAADIPIVEDGRRQIMHHKFTVIDGEWVQTGSWNYTGSETYRNNNHSIVVQSRALAESFSAEFEKMFGARQFGSAKPASVPQPVLSFGGSRAEVYFSPRDRGAAQVIRWITSARQRIHFLAFSFTHDGIGDAMLERARAGVEVAGVFEGGQVDGQFSEFGRLKQAGLDVLQDGNPRTMHHKVILVDTRVSIFGSFNFTSNADRQNDENLLIVDDPGLAGAFEAEYQRVRAVALNPPVRR